MRIQLMTAALAFVATAASADPLKCNLAGYKATPGLTAGVADESFGKHHFQIPFNATGKKWVRFAVWDSAGNGAMVQPIRLSSATTSTAGGR